MNTGESCYVNVNVNYSQLYNASCWRVKTEKKMRSQQVSPSLAYVKVQSLTFTIEHDDLRVSLR